MLARLVFGAIVIENLANACLTNSTIPCRRTTTCNGIDYVEDFSYNEFWACNTQYQTCPITGETVVTQHDWADVYVSNCVMYGVCQDGTQKILEYGASVSGPFLIEDRSCSTDFRCFDYACQFKNGLFIDESSSNYCSEILIFPNSPDCSKGECKMFVLCGNTKMGFFCSKCNSSGFKGSKAPQIPTRVFIKREDTILSVSLLKNDILDYANTYHKTTHTEIKLDLPMNTTGYQDVMIYPNPTDGNVTIDFKSKIDGLEIEIYDILGRLVYAKSFKEPTKKKTIDLGFLRDGIYLIHLLDSTHKIAIERLIIE